MVYKIPIKYLLYFLQSHPKDDMKKCILTINILQFMYFVVNYFVPYEK